MARGGGKRARKGAVSDNQTHDDTKNLPKRLEDAYDFVDEDADEEKHAGRYDVSCSTCNGLIAQL